MLLTGKGMFIWRVRGCEDGNVDAIVNLCKVAGLTHILLKVADGNFSYNIDTKTGEDLALNLARALKSNNIQVYGWHYVYGYDPKTEADRAIQRVTQLGLDGYVIDAEYEYKENHRAARLFMDRLRGGLTTLPIGLSSYRFPTLHPQLPWVEFLSKCDFNMPQVYWLLSHNPGEQLRRCQQSFQKIAPYRPIIPTGSIFRHGDWMPTLEEMAEFVATARELNMPAVNFWEWSKARRYHAEIWNWLAAYDWSSGVQIAQDISEQYITGLNSHNLEQLLKLYRPEAVHVTDTRVVQGQSQLRVYFDTLLNRTLPGGVFTLTSYSGKGGVRHLTWTATARSGSVHNGSDTLGLVNGKIAYHYSDYRII
jgi:hypothetical protein